MGGLLHLVQRGGAWAGCVPAQSPPRCTKCNSPSINGQCTNFILFDMALSLHLNSKRLTSKVKRRHQTKSIRGRHLGRSEIKLVQSEIIQAVDIIGFIDNFCVNSRLYSRHRDVAFTRFNVNNVFNTSKRSVAVKTFFHAFFHQIHYYHHHVRYLMLTKRSKQHAVMKVELVKVQHKTEIKTNKRKA